MATHSKVPAWVQRRISERPAARWISWNAGRPQPVEAQPANRALSAAVLPDYGENVVFLFRRTG